MIKAKPVAKTKQNAASHTTEIDKSSGQSVKKESHLNPGHYPDFSTLTDHEHSILAKVYEEEFLKSKAADYTLDVKAESSMNYDLRTLDAAICNMHQSVDDLYAKLEPVIDESFFNYEEMEVIDGGAANTPVAQRSPVQMRIRAFTYYVERIRALVLHAKANLVI